MPSHSLADPSLTLPCTVQPLWMRLPLPGLHPGPHPCTALLTLLRLPSAAPTPHSSLLCLLPQPGLPGNHRLPSPAQRVMGAGAYGLLAVLPPDTTKARPC